MRPHQGFHVYSLLLRALWFAYTTYQISYLRSAHHTTDHLIPLNSSVLFSAAPNGERSSTRRMTEREWELSMQPHATTPMLLRSIGVAWMVPFLSNKGDETTYDYTIFHAPFQRACSRRI